MVHDYDKIFKENIESIIIPFTRRLLGAIPTELEEIPDDLQRTIERRPDFLKKATLGKETFILHIEFQTEDEEDMVHRMLEYCALLTRRYKLEVRQYVVYLRDHRAQMQTTLRHGNNLLFSFTLINIYDIPYQEFLESDIPEEVILAILGNFGNTASDIVIEALLERLKSLNPETNRRKKCVNQMEILSKLRKLQGQTIKKINIMPFQYNLHEDLRYIQGAEDKEKEMLQILREQQLREQQLREQQLREQQLREQQLREQQLREQQLREQQQQMLEQQKQAIRNLLKIGLSAMEVATAMVVPLSLVEDIAKKLDK